MGCLTYAPQLPPPSLSKALRAREKCARARHGFVASMARVAGRCRVAAATNAIPVVAHSAMQPIAPGDIRKLGSRGPSRREESPGSTKQGWRVTPAGCTPSDVHQGKVPQRANRRWRLPQGDGQARVKGCGKSAPGCWQQGPHGKPHPEQGRIGASRLRDCRQESFAPRGPGWLLERCSNAPPR